MKCCEVLRIKLAQCWHGKHRKTLVYSTRKGLVVFPLKEKVSTHTY